MKRAGDPKYIPGIYNYCDRWCERCQFTARCLNYDAAEEDSGNLETRDINNKAFWDQLSRNFEMALEMLRDMAKERGIDMSATDLQEINRQEEINRKQAEEHDLALWSLDYMRATDRWFKDNERFFKQKGAELVRTYKLALPGTNAEAEADSMRDCVEVIRWYQLQIHTKLIRALMRDDSLLAMLDGDESLPSDSDGSTKVALIGIDRSISAWSRLREFLPEASDDILDILLILDRIRKRAEQTFPKARAFVRPGFDTEKEMATKAPSH